MNENSTNPVTIGSSTVSIVEYDSQRLITPAMHEGELRILDEELGSRLGYAKAANIRELIGRWEADLGRLGVIRTVRKTSGSKGGRPAEAYYLNRKQALFITQKSDTPNAVDISIEVIERFDAYERGESSPAHPAVPTSFREALLLAAQQQEKIEAQEKALAVAQPKADAHDSMAELPGDLGVRDAGRELKVGQAWVTEYIDKHGWSCVEGGKRKPAHYGLKQGYCRFVRKPYTHPHTGEEMVREDFRLTGKGVARLAEIIAKKKAANTVSKAVVEAAPAPFARAPEAVS